MFLLVSIQQTSPPYSPVCPGDDAVFTCNVTNSTLLIWDYYGQTEAYLAGSPSERVLGGFNLTLVSTMSRMIRSDFNMSHLMIMIEI